MEGSDPQSIRPARPGHRRPPRRAPGAPVAETSTSSAESWSSPGTSSKRRPLGDSWDTTKGGKGHAVASPRGSAPQGGQRGRRASPEIGAAWEEMGLVFPQRLGAPDGVAGHADETLHRIADLQSRADAAGLKERLIVRLRYACATIGLSRARRPTFCFSGSDTRTWRRRSESTRTLLPGQAEGLG